MPALPRPYPLFLATTLLLAFGLGADGCPGPAVEWQTVVLEDRPDLEFQLREAALLAKPGTIIELPAGTFPFRGSISVETDHVKIVGQGMYETILDFTDQVQGAQGILANSDNFTVQNFAIINPRGDGIKSEFSDWATYDQVRVEWNTEPDESHGDYGLYPAQNKNVLISGCIVKGARDAGIYVGQSENVIVRWSHVEKNVLGIEIENSINADVYGNTAMNNSAGIAVFHLPNLQVDGRKVRVFDNQMHDNNHPNFAPIGGFIGLVPPGSGGLSISNDDVEWARNEFSGNKTVNLGISSFKITFETIRDADYDPFIEGLYAYDNVLSNGGYEPAGLLGTLVLTGLFLGQPIPDIVVGGWVDANKIPGGLTVDALGQPDPFPAILQAVKTNRICLRNNTGTFGSGNGFVLPFPLFDLAPYDCRLPLLAPTVLPPAPPPEPMEEPYSEAEIAALCTPGAGVNWDAYVVNCPDLADYNLFQDPSVPTTNANAGGHFYDLAMPLFSDYTSKDRYFFIPPGQAIQYSADGVWQFPLGTIIAKSFGFVSAVHDDDRVVETRLLIKRESGWEGLPYIWTGETPNRAELKIGGGLVEYTDAGGSEQSYWIPSIADCGSCHFGLEGDVPIGPKTHNVNQIDELRTAGILPGAPDASTLFQLPGLDGWDQAGADINLIARAYLDSNCAHCHNPIGRAGFTGYDLEYDEDPFDWTYGLCKSPVAAGSGAGTLLWDVHPGQPDESILIFRVESNEAEVKMPEIERNLVHREGADMLRAWVSQLPGDCAAE